MISVSAIVDGAVNDVKGEMPSFLTRLRSISALAQVSDFALVESVEFFDAARCVWVGSNGCVVEGFVIFGEGWYCVGSLGDEFRRQMFPTALRAHPSAAV